MSKNRFNFLINNLRFDDKSTRAERKAADKFAPFREFWELFELNCNKYYTPSEYVTVDETLLSFRGRCSFRMYLPSKPDKYGLKIISACDAKTYYFLGGIPYLGKEITTESNELSTPTRYVVKLTQSIQGSNRNVTTDNWFTSCELAKELTKRKLTLVGTMRKNKKEIPPYFVNTKGTPVMSSRFIYDPEKMMVSFTPKKNKVVILLSSFHDTGVIDEETGKPEIVLFYNMTKGGVDVFDQMCHSESTTRKTRRWPLRYFFGVLDFAGVNAFVLYKLNNAIDSYSSAARNTFLKTLANDLAEPFMKIRAYNKKLPKALRLGILDYVGEDNSMELELLPLVPSKKPRRCEECIDRGVKKDRKGYSFCAKCERCLCGEHKVIMCHTCVNDEDSS